LTCIGVSVARIEEFLLSEEVQGQVRGGGHTGALVCIYIRIVTRMSCNDTPIYQFMMIAMIDELTKWMYVDHSIAYQRW
jgi:hypothetical protein